ncbi:hypothetical protein HRW14_30330 [Streptomyces lunaelactis]|uniref:hypothetical protein n=1 Tax=Streptomyces lunaelactis TaxID=1535768 RepID=UPI001585C3B1|nr:hypothetical protein [Streptomyces lunaelactis]NUK54487.1 hypothetical protein [Streptomyces lunaelactis]NUK68430.1 hypothetical protein [Streptomyces lunaelactis]
MADPQSNAALPAIPEDAPRAGLLHVCHRHTDRFTVVGNHLAQHKSLSATAIGLAVDTWLARDAGPAQSTRTLTANLPSVPIHHPARFLEHRLSALLPPPLPTAPAVEAVAPLRTCHGCERAFRSHDPDERCRDCRPGERAAA